MPIAGGEQKKMATGPANFCNCYQSRAPLPAATYALIVTVHQITEVPLFYRYHQMDAHYLFL
jgi:hypothetical protein